MVFMLLMPAWALIVDVQKWMAGGSFLLVGVGALLLGVTAWMAIEGLLLWKRAKGVLEEPIPEQSQVR
jgi:hypothetical protein